MVTADDYPPYSNKSSKGGGLAPQLIQEIFKGINLDYELKWEPWKRGYINTLQRKYLETFPYSKNKERLKVMPYSAPLLTIDFKFFVLSDPKKELL